MPNTVHVWVRYAVFNWHTGSVLFCVILWTAIHWSEIFAHATVCQCPTETSWSLATHLKMTLCTCWYQSESHWVDSHSQVAWHHIGLWLCLVSLLASSQKKTHNLIAHHLVAVMNMLYSVKIEGGSWCFWDFKQFAVDTINSLFKQEWIEIISCHFADIDT